MNFIRNHRYFTRAQRLSRNSGKVENYLRLARRLVRLRREGGDDAAAAGGIRDTQPMRPI
jgi:hypothetical protein